MTQMRTRKNWLRYAAAYFGACVVVMVALPLLGALYAKFCGPLAALQSSRIFSFIGPILCLALICLVMVIWWFWEPLVRSQNIPAASKDAWILARNRVAIWGLAYAALGAYSLFVR